MNSQGPFTPPRSFYSASLLLLVFNNLASGLHYVFQAMMARHLTMADFGLMNALFGMISFISLPITIYVSTLARQWAELTNAARHEEANRLWYALVVTAGGACVIGILIGLCLVPWMAWWLKTSNLIVVGVAVIGAGIGVVLGLANPLAMARQWFALMAIGGVVGALFRIGIAKVGIIWGVQLSGAVVATTIYSGILATVVFWLVPWPGWRSLPFEKLLPSKREWIAPLLVAVSTFCICGADLLVVRRVYDPDQAGVFAQVMILGRIILFLIGPITLVVFPKTASSLQMNESHRETKVVRRALALGTAILLSAALAASLLAPLGFTLLRGSSDPELVYLLRIAVWCLIPLSLSQLVLSSLFARRQEKHLLEFTLICLLLPLGLAAFRGHLVHAFLVEGTMGIILLGFTALRLRYTIQKETRR